jgi:hypothetical protein
MKKYGEKKYFNIIWFFSLFLFIFIIQASRALADTEVGGELKKNTTWTASNSPYILIKTVIVPKKYTLTIEPGVTVSMPGNYNDMFTLEGRIIALGEENNKIIFDGGGNSNFFNAQGSTATAFLDLDYCEIRNGGYLWNHGYGYFHLRHSLMENLSNRSYIFYPGNDIYIEHNEFKNTGGFSIGLGDGINAYIKYNLFNGKNPALPSFEDYHIQNWASFGDSETVVQYNTFSPDDGIVLRLPSGYNSAAMMASENYWGTTDEEIINDMIYDKNDDMTSAGYIDYLPILSEPDPNTPGTIIKPAAPTVDSYATSTTEETQIITGTKATDTSLWINGEEIVAQGTSTVWTYEASLSIGENSFAFSVQDKDGIASEAVTITIIRSGIVCEAWVYSDWGKCVNGQQERTIISAAPEGCADGEPILGQSCQTGTVIDNTVAEEKALVATIDKNLSSRLSGRILLQVEKNGEAWYVYPNDLKKYYLGRPSDAFSVMRLLGLGATHEFITSHTTYPDYVLGKILLDVEEHGEAYYINPLDNKAYYLGRPADAFAIMRNFGLGITNENIRKIEVGEVE